MNIDGQLMKIFQPKFSFSINSDLLTSCIDMFSSFGEVYLGFVRLLLGFGNWNLVAYKEIIIIDISHWNYFLSNSIISVYATKFQSQIPKADGHSLSECVG